jgi:hypothetical protein
MRGMVYIALGLFLVGFAAFIFQYGLQMRTLKASGEMVRKSDLKEYQFGPSILNQ